MIIVFMLNFVAEDQPEIRQKVHNFARVKLESQDRRTAGTGKFQTQEDLQYGRGHLMGAGAQMMMLQRNHILAHAVNLTDNVEGKDIFYKK